MRLVLWENMAENVPAFVVCQCLLVKQRVAEVNFRLLEHYQDDCCGPHYKGGPADSDGGSGRRPAVRASRCRSRSFNFSIEGNDELTRLERHLEK